MTHRMTPPVAMITFALLLLFYHANFRTPYPKQGRSMEKQGNDSISNTSIVPSVLGPTVFGPSTRSNLGEAPAAYTRTLVVPQTASDNTSWLQTLSNINVTVYSVDDSPAPFRAPTNKGHEALVYLSYLIDHHDSLPDLIIFMHAHRHAWHNADLLGLDAAAMLSRLDPGPALRDGYVNLRCAWDPGCPAHLFPLEDSAPLGRQEQGILAASWAELFPLDPLPAVLAQPCCAQFALSGERAARIPLARLVHWRDWLLRTQLTDYYSGRVWEFVWQWALAGKAVSCPPEWRCWCELYGACFGGEDGWRAFQALRAERAALQERLEEARRKAAKGVVVVEGDGATDAVLVTARIDALDALIERERRRALERGRME